MRRNTSVAAAILAAGAGYLAMRLWNDNAGGVRDKAARLRLRGQDAWRRGISAADRTWRRARGQSGASYYDEYDAYYVAEPMVDTYVGEQRTRKSAARSADVSRHPSAF